MSEYAVIPHLSNISLEVLTSREFCETQMNVYKAFNKEGAILAEFGELVPSTRNMRISETTYDYERDNVQVNPNYLKEFPVYDPEGNRILIDESEKDYLILLPDKYKDKEREIRGMFQKWKECSSDEFTKIQPIKVIWTKSNQKIFSMIMDVNPKENNYVTDPIIRVLTENNAEIIEFRAIGRSFNPIKIRVQGTMNIESSVRPILKEYDMNKYVNVIASANEDVKSEIKKVQERQIFMIGGIIFIVCAIIILLFQNVYNYFEQYKQQLAVRQFHGYKVINKYKEYSIAFALNWGIVIMSLLVVGSIPIQRLFFISVIAIILELVINLMILRYTSSRKTINVIKGSN